MEWVEVRGYHTNAHYVHVLHYYCLIDINTEIKVTVVVAEVICFSLCKLGGCKLRGGVNLQEIFKPKMHKTNWCKTRPGCICNQSL